MFDYHIHSETRANLSPKEFLAEAAAGGVTGGVIISDEPLHYCSYPDRDQRWEYMLDYVLDYTSQTPGFLPMFWIDPTDEDVDRQIDTAIEKGIAGFKIICNHFFPKDILKPLRHIAETGRPVNFHCGILYSPSTAADYNRPAAFECLMQVKGLRFSLAHAGWPWTDEYNAILGEFFWNGDVDVYADLTPGTPPVYRREMLRHLYLCGFRKLKTHILWGTDRYTNNYSGEYAGYLSNNDKKILADVVKEAPSIYEIGDFFNDSWEYLEHKNAETFLGLK